MPEAETSGIGVQLPPDKFNSRPDVPLYSTVILKYQLHVLVSVAYCDIYNHAMHYIQYHMYVIHLSTT